MTDVLGSRTFLRSDSDPDMHVFEYDIDSEICVNGNVPVACACNTFEILSCGPDDETSYKNENWVKKLF